MLSIVANPDQHNHFPIGVTIEPDYANIAQSQGATLLPFEPEFADCNFQGAFNRKEYGTYSTIRNRGTQIEQFQIRVGNIIYADCMSRVHWAAKVIATGKTKRLLGSMSPMPLIGCNMSAITASSEPFRLLEEWSGDAKIIEGWFDIAPTIPGFYAFGIHAHMAFEIECEWLAMSRTRR